MKSLRLKILMGFACILALLIVLTVVVSINLFKVSKDIDRLDEDIKLLNGNANLSQNITERVSLARGYLLYGEESFKQSFFEHTEESKEIEEVVLANEPSEEVQHLIELSVEFGNIVEGELFPLYDSGDIEGAIRLERDKIAELAEEIVLGYEDVMEYEQSVIEKNMDELVSASTTTNVITISLAVAAIVVGIVVSFVLANKITTPVLQVVNRMNQVSTGDLSGQSLQTNSKDEVGLLTESVNDTTASLKGLVRSVNDATSQVAASSEQLSASAIETTKGTEQVVTTIEELTNDATASVETINQSVESINEMAHKIETIAETSSSVSKVVSETKDAAESGNEKVQEAVRQMSSIGGSVHTTAKTIQALGHKSEEINNIISVISDISGQTNLLALNAAIEAARAGEHGKGFSIVADEVRKLAEQTENSTKQIAALISEIQAGTTESVQSMTTVTNEVNSGTTIVNEAGQTFTEIVTMVNEVVKHIKKVSSISTELANSSKKVKSSFADVKEKANKTSEGAEVIASTSQQQLAAMEEITASSQVLSEMAEALQKEIEVFKI
ncbi:methyl-accepting chemotaxis protein [Alkalihalobacillus sp. LMS39]|uniref:methyl-accepting chemotaxis protein n=1 Tax=Alkalihalobacillus sp. LMS39 TaxID=2924032 RepID=UPI001FB1CFD2|nr:methyl-accepting chemotaxis protein [Alkalihalobacillus sp. LMS39]UOE96383.1 methyl-accepting chemotaxis protein [Alkalihalobacillus sp. LMS39]